MIPPFIFFAFNLEIIQLMIALRTFLRRSFTFINIAASPANPAVFPVFLKY